MPVSIEKCRIQSAEAKKRKNESRLKEAENHATFGQSSMQLTLERVLDVEQADVGNNEQ